MWLQLTDRLYCPINNLTTIEPTQYEKCTLKCKISYEY